jgi:putative acetyltransferase
MTMELKFIWTDGTNADFKKLNEKMEEYYNALSGGSENRMRFIPLSRPEDIRDVLIAYDGGVPVACASFRKFAGFLTQGGDAPGGIAEIKRVWVEKEYRGRGIAKTMLPAILARARQRGYRTAVLQTRTSCREAISLYRSLGFERISCYPPYDTMPEAVCCRREL